MHAKPPTRLSVQIGNAIDSYVPPSTGMVGPTLEDHISDELVQWLQSSPQIYQSGAPSCGRRGGGEGPKPLSLDPANMCASSGLVYSSIDEESMRSKPYQECKSVDLFSGKHEQREGRLCAFPNRLEMYDALNRRIGYIHSDGVDNFQTVSWNDTGEWVTSFYMVSMVRFRFILTLNAYDEFLNLLGFESLPPISMPGGGVFKGITHGGKSSWVAEKGGRIHTWTRFVSISFEES